MPATTAPRSFIMTVFGVVGFLWFAVHAAEYVYARYDGLQSALPLPDPLGVAALFEAMPQWAGIALTAAIWLGLLGALLLIVQDRAAVIVLSFTFLASLPVLVWAGLAFAEGMEVIGSLHILMFAGAQVAMALGLWLYARTAKRYGIF